MFLLIGVGQRIKETDNFNCTCPACGRAASFHGSKQYSSLNLFFIPVLSFGTEYIATCGSCASVVALPKDKGRDLECTSYASIQPGDLTIIRNNAGPACGSCNARINPGQPYCHNCGIKL